MEPGAIVAMVTGAANGIGRAIAAAAGHLVSADNTYLAGQRVVVDGGLTITL